MLGHYLYSVTRVENVGGIVIHLLTYNSQTKKMNNLQQAVQYLMDN